MITFSPLNCDLKEYAREIECREYWDSLSHEWTYSLIEEKLIILGGFVLKGGNLNQFLESYAEERAFTYRIEIQKQVLSYIIYLITGDSLYERSEGVITYRIKRLEKEEFVQLLTEELKKRVRKTCSMEDGNIVEHWEVSRKNLDNDEILDRIEREHWRMNPQEPFSAYLRKSDRWDDFSWSVW